MTQLNGSLDGIGLGQLIGFLGDLKARGRLTVAQDSTTGMLFFDQGRLVGAMLGSDTGQDALDGIALLLSKGRFAFSDQEDNLEVNLSIDPDHLKQHLEQLAPMGERLSASVGSLAAIPVVASPSGPDDQGLTLDMGALRLLMSCDGRRSVGELARPHGLVATVRRLAQLVELQLVTIQAPTDRPTPAGEPVGPLAAAAAELSASGARPAASPPGVSGENAASSPTQPARRRWWQDAGSSQPESH